MKRHLLIILFLLGSVFSYSQSTLNYNFTNSSTESLTDMSASATDLLVPASPDGEFISTLAPIGFDFWVMGNRYTHFSVNSNGLMRLGKTQITNASLNTAANSATNSVSLYAFWDNLNSYSTSSTSKVRYKVSGNAPNRILTVEWKDFIICNNSLDADRLSTWQVRLYETSGVFEYVYGRMQVSIGSTIVSASIGMTYLNINNSLIYVTSLSSPAVLRTSAGFITNLVNTSTAGNIASLNSYLNGSRVKYSFTPVLPTADPTNLTFTAVANNTMTLNWNDNSSNERGYVIYRSDDGGVTYNFVSQTTANITSAIQSALSPATTYFWKVYAVTEGALSNPVTGSQATDACLGTSLNTLTFTGGAGATVNWSTAAWSLGVPTACQDVEISFVSSADLTATYVVNMDMPVTVNNLTIKGDYGGTGAKVLQIQTNGRSLNVLGNLNMSATGGTGFASAGNLVNFFATTGSVITINGNTSIGNIGDTKTTRFGGATSPANQDPQFYFKGNVTFNDNGTTSFPGTYYFDGGTNQVITNNCASSSARFGEVEIGKFKATTLTITGSYAINTNADTRSLTVNEGSTLVLPNNSAFNQFVPNKGAFILKANATLKLGDNSGGLTGSNFPFNYSFISIDKNSTVEYNSLSPDDQIIYTGLEYGNLVLSNSSRKYINGILTIDGNFTNNAGSTFGCDLLTLFNGSNFINHGIVDGLNANSDFKFYGSIPQTYSGTGSFGNSVVPFGGWGVGIYNHTGVTLNAPVYTNRVNLFNGTFYNSNHFKIGTASFGLVQRGGLTDEHAGAFDTYPVINCVNNYTVRYDNANPVIAGPEIPLSGKVYNFYSNNVTGVTLSANLDVSNDLKLLEHTLDLSANSLKIGNTVTISSGNIDADEGTVEYYGSASQVIAANTFQSNSLKHLVISNTDNVTGVTLGGTLDVYGSVTFGAAGRKLTTGGYLSFKSTSTGTAWLGPLTGSNTIVGDATVERYIPLHAKAWQFLAAPTSGQTINAAWQEGNTPLSSALNPAYGTLITNHVAGTGFDIIGGTGPSMKTYDSASHGFVGIANTSIAIYNRKGYMLFVRGDRTVSSVSGPTTSANLRTKGTLFTPANPPSVINLSANTFESVGNPYPSAIDLTALSLSGGVQDVFYVWDPKVTTSPSAYGLGAYQTFTRNGATYDVTPGGGSYPGGTSKTIESGQAFFVRAPAAVGSVTFTEGCKVSGSSDVNRAPVSNAGQLKTNLYVITGNSRVLLDGNMVQYDGLFSNNIDMDDAVKLGNTGENLGIKSQGSTLVVERRSLITQTDTIFYNLGQVRVKQYEFELMPRRLSREGLEAFLEDSYLGTRTAVSLQDTTRVLFNVVNVPGSYATDRFRVVFNVKKKTKNHPVFAAFETAKGNTGQADIAIKAKVNQHKSQSGELLVPGVEVYPNPVINKSLQLKFTSLPAGEYNLELIYSNGMKQFLNSLQITEGKTTYSVNLPHFIAPGIYRLQVSGNDNIKFHKVLNVL